MTFVVIRLLAHWNIQNAVAYKDRFIAPVLTEAVLTIIDLVLEIEGDIALFIEVPGDAVFIVAVDSVGVVAFGVVEES